MKNHDLKEKKKKTRVSTEKALENVRKATVTLAILRTNTIRSINWITTQKNGNFRGPNTKFVKENHNYFILFQVLFWKVICIPDKMTYLLVIQLHPTKIWMQNHSLWETILATRETIDKVRKGNSLDQFSSLKGKCR